MIEREEDMNMEKIMSSSDKSHEEDLLLPGFRFHPTDEELVGFYLRRKVEKKPLSIEIIKQIDIYKHDPWDLPKVSNGGEECYFFCRRGRKYKNSIRPNRVTGSGFWKATGIDRPIYSAAERSNDCIGLKKSLVYYRGSAGKGTKTDWMMHEFRLPSGGKTTSTALNAKNNQEAEIWTICRIFKRAVSYRKYTPDWSDSSSFKQNSTEASSKTCSFESDPREKYHSFATSNIQHVEKKPVISYMNEEKNQLLSCQSSLPALYSSSDTNEFFRESNWDELRAFMEFGNDPNFLL